ncbi:hypothetical protein Y034_6154 [Burkholderia pseudomallei MSHR449]|nr:hypothetical protein Y034_6154 [Burkholderia pseudomallei MSHR449]
MPIKADLDDRGDARADPAAIEDGDPALDDAGLGQLAHAPHAGRRRRERALGERQVRQRRVRLQRGEDTKVQFVERVGQALLLARAGLKFNFKPKWNDMEISENRYF